MPIRFTIRDLIWLTLLLAMAVVWWADHRHAARQLSLCIQAVDQTAEELEDARAESEKHIAALRSDLDRTDRARAQAERRAAINAERPLSTPGPFIRP